ncbi:T9SS type A sorting domain-containing protein [Porphyromonas sp. COT-239 OH1446]|uniref:T9SS type A sorting domain-containing protein n=1 Tax=Porphyromonas sp. COT-239 OH1446 TaxID=1515613 RepID=UPI00052B6592|nr:T9SS type A sorting domain-containing protein [Porphyromonas sp. COT-239 OH1446]KGN71168.1 hypothetical protein HQ37_03270 [Porphyromonas sp. COT-239 OH1446]
MKIARVTPLMRALLLFIACLCAVNSLSAQGFSLSSGSSPQPRPTDSLRISRRLRPEVKSRLLPQQSYGINAHRRTMLIRPEFGVLPIRDGSTIILNGETPIASYEPLDPRPSSIRDLSPRGIRQSSGIRLMGRTLYFSDPAERVELIDVTGKVVLAYRNVREAKLNLPEGIYIMRCNINDDYTVSRLILR